MIAISSCSGDSGSGGGEAGEGGDGAAGSSGGAATGGNGGSHAGQGGSATAGTAGASAAGTGGGSATAGTGGASAAGTGSSCFGGDSTGAGGADGGTGTGDGGNRSSAGEGGEAGAGGEATTSCKDNEYQEVGVAGCRACSNWKYAISSEGTRVLGPNLQMDRTAKELRLAPLETYPLPKSWKGLAVSLFDTVEYEPIACSGEVHYSVRDGWLVADYSEIHACAEAANVEGVLQISGFQVDYGCAGAGKSIGFVEVGMTAGDAYFDAETVGPAKLLIEEAPLPEFAGESHNDCTAQQYAEPGYADCRACGDWHYTGFDLSCRVVGTHNYYDAAAGELIIEPGPDLPIPVDWADGSAFGPGLIHVDPNVSIPPCVATIDTFVRDGLMIADVSEFQDCVAGLPSGAYLQFGGSILLDYGCAGGGCGSVYLDVNLTGGDGPVAAQCFGVMDWPAKHYPELHP